MLLAFRRPLFATSKQSSCRVEAKAAGRGKNGLEAIGMKQALFCVAMLLIAAAASADLDKYGGWDGVKGKATGFFRVEQLNGRWWIIDPLGNAFISVGVCHVTYWGDRIQGTDRSPYNEAVSAKYGGIQAWAEPTAKRLRGWNLNTIGAWSVPAMWQQGLPYTVILNIGASAGGSWLRGTFPDVFSPRFRQIAGDIANRDCRPRAEDDMLLGYFTDNELRWGPDWRSNEPIFSDFMALPAEAGGKQAVVDLLAARYNNDTAAFNANWGQKLAAFEDLLTVQKLPLPAQDAGKARADQAAFLQAVAGQYFRVCREAIRKAAPNHMILGCRFAGYALPEVLAGMKDHVDIVSYNNYDQNTPTQALNWVHQQTDRPVMITEFSFKAMDSGLPNTKGAAQPVPTQKDRADGYERYVTGLLKLPFLVGWHWFQWSDQPAEGRFDGENSNYGLVNIKDEPWQVLTERMTAFNRRVYELAQNP